MNDMKKLLRRMIENEGFIARGIYSDKFHYWKGNNSHSQSMIDLNLFQQMCRLGYLKKDLTGRYYPTEKGRDYAAPWYKKIFDII